MNPVNRLYIREDRTPKLGYSHCEELGIKDYVIYTDKPYEETAMSKLLEEVKPGDRVIVGTIMDFMYPEIEDLKYVLTEFAENNITVISKLEPNYTFKKYVTAIPLANAISRIRLGIGYQD